MPEDKSPSITKLTPDELSGFIGMTPADNVQSLDTALPWKSKMIGGQIGTCSATSGCLTLSAKISTFSVHGQLLPRGKARFWIHCSLR